MRIDVERLLVALGIKATRRGKSWAALCPGHDDKDPSWRIVDDPRSNRHGSHHCFSCGFGGGPWELVAHVRDCTIDEAGRWVRDEMLGERALEDDDVPKVVVRGRPPVIREMLLPSGVVIPSLDGSEWFAPAREYLDRRGVPEWQRERWHIGYATRGRCRMRVVVPVVTSGRLLSYVARAFVNDPEMPRYDAGRRTDPGCRPDVALFGEPAFEAPDADGRRGVATVTEGVFKALAMERAGAPNPCAVLGSQNLGPEKIASLASFRTILLAMDPDKAGDASATILESMLGRWCDVRRVPLVVAPDDADEDTNARALEEVFRG